MVDYVDFDLKLEPRRQDGYPVLVLSSPGGQGRGTFVPPSELLDLRDHLFHAIRARRAGAGRGNPISRDVKRRSSADVAGSTAKRIGGQLFDSLLSGPVQELFQNSLGRTASRDGHGLRIALHLDPSHPDLLNLSGIPWEFLYQSRTRDFLSLNWRTPIVRYLDLPRAAHPPLALPLRILVAIANPRGQRRLNVERERNLIEEALARHSAIEAKFLEHASLKELQKRLAGGEFQVLHFIGHGAFDRGTGTGGIALEGAGPATLSGLNLATLLKNAGIQLAVLNACDTARLSEEEGSDPFAGMAPALVMGGVAAVIAMQFPISDRAAIAFSEAFYLKLAAGEPIARAITEGRLGILVDDPNSLEWGTPVLFLRTDAEVRERKPPPPLPPPEPDVWTNRILRHLTRLAGVLLIGMLTFLGGERVVKWVAPASDGSPGTEEIGIEEQRVPPHPPSECGLLTLDLDSGTLNGLSSEMTPYQLQAGLPFDAEVKAGDSVRFDQIGLRFYTKRRFIELKDGFPETICLDGKPPIELLGKSYDSVVTHLPDSSKDDGHNYNHSTLSGCLQISLKNKKIYRLRLYSKDCSVVPLPFSL